MQTVKVKSSELRYRVVAMLRYVLRYSISGQWRRMRSLIWACAARLCTKTHFSMTRPRQSLHYPWNYLWQFNEQTESDEFRRERCTDYWPRGYKTFFMLNSAMKFFMLINLKLLTMPNYFLLNIAEHENFSANKYENANYCWHFHIY